MLTLTGSKYRNSCDGIGRRHFLRFGSLAAAGCFGPKAWTPSLGAFPPPTSSSSRSLIMIYLPGGPTQHETFDPKPDAPSEIRGPYGTTPTSQSGIRFGEWLPRLAANSHRFSIVRTLTGMMNRHESFQCYTGRAGGRNEDREPTGGWPGIGSVVSKVLGPAENGMLPYIDAAPKMSYRPYNNLGAHDASSKISWPGFTGRAHTPFALEGDVKQDLTLNQIDESRLSSRRTLLETLQQRQQLLDKSGLSEYQEQAFGLLTSSQLADALDLSQEPESTRRRYGSTQPTDPSFGGAPQSPHHFILARRLVEAGVRCVTVAFGAWDWHANREGNIEHLAKKYLPLFDQALAALLEDLDDRGLLDQVSVVVWGEFGRTPRINAKGGRDHWPNTQSILLAGGGFQGGRIVGETDHHGGSPIDRPVHIQEVFASLYHNLGIDTNQTKITDLNGRPRYLVDENRQRIAELY